MNNEYMTDTLHLLNSQIHALARQAALISEFNYYNPCASIKMQKWFLAWVKHSDLTYSEIMEKWEDD